MKKSFVLYLDQYNAIKSLSREQRGDLLEAFYLYHSGINLPSYDQIVEVALSFIKIDFKDDEERRLKNRNYPEYIKWRKKVLVRDNFFCTACGTNKDLQAHHIKSFNDYPELRVNIDNGITLCAECHKKEHKV